MKVLAAVSLLCGLCGLFMSLRSKGRGVSLQRRLNTAKPKADHSAFSQARLLTKISRLRLLTHRIFTRRKCRAFRDELPEALSLVTNAVSSGHSLSTALRMTAEHSPGVVGIEWRRAITEAEFGMDLFDALERTAIRMRSDELAWVVTVLRINRDIGGEVTTVLRPIRDAMRERAALRQKARALTAEGRLSAIVLGALPFAFGGFLLLTRPEYLVPLVRQPLGLVMLVMATTLLVAGLWWMRLLVGGDHR